MSAKFEIFKDSINEYRFRLKAPNGEIIAVSEGYTTKQNAQKGIEAVKEYANEADVSDNTANQ